MPLNCGAGELSWESWTARRSSQSTLKAINPEYSLEGLMLKLKLQYFGLVMWTDDSLEKSLMLGTIEGRRRGGHRRVRWLNGITSARNMNLGKLWEMVRDREVCHVQSLGLQRVRHNWAIEQQQEIIISLCLTILNLRHQFSPAFELRLKCHWLS